MAHIYNKMVSSNLGSRFLLFLVYLRETEGHLERAMAEKEKNNYIHTNEAQKISQRNPEGEKT